MSEVGVYAVYDHKSKLFDIPFFARGDVMAARRFIMDVKRVDAQNMLRTFKDEFEVWRLGYFDQIEGKFREDKLIIHQGKEIED